MKKILSLCSVLLCMLFCFSGCASSKILAKVGTKIGETYQEAAAEGIVSAEESIVAWPYISGQLKGVLASNYDLDVPTSAQTIINNLDELAAKDVSTLTDEEKGKIIGYFCRLEQIAAKELWEDYGVDLTNMLQSLF